MKTINKLDEISNISYKTKSKDKVEIVYRSLGYLREFDILLDMDKWFNLINCTIVIWYLTKSKFT